MVQQAQHTAELNWLVNRPLPLIDSHPVSPSTTVSPWLVISPKQAMGLLSMALSGGPALISAAQLIWIADPRYGSTVDVEGIGPASH
ncbi:hypothetical protein [Burkholderia cepacia]|uniref:hypothetical protein n=1 Tax=Burkholderia cepacia TaxID=292 RepID=UPI001588984A|nr:hypothetical protein [Burkholderia cepacia]